MRLICYLSNGFPTLTHTLRLADNYVKSGCDIIQIDLPARNPFLESEFIRERMQHALNQCSDYNQYMASIAAIRRSHPDLPIFLLAYQETLETIDLTKFTEFCQRNQIINLTIIGLDRQDIRTRLIQEGFQISSYVRRPFPADEIEAAMKTNGFVYLQVKPEAPTDTSLKDDIARLREIFGTYRPVYCGVGIHTVSDIQDVLNAGADGAFIGTTILRVADTHQLAETIHAFKAPILMGKDEII